MEHRNEASRLEYPWVSPVVAAPERSGRDWRNDEIVLIDHHRVLCVLPDRCDR
jgi:hypothetical protein